MTVSIEQLSAYHDGELAAEERRTVERHLTGCPDCQGAVRGWIDVSRWLALSAPSRRRALRVRPIIVAGIAALLLLSGVAVAGPFNEIFRSGNVTAVGSRPVSLEEARIAKLPLPSSRDLPGGWTLDQVQLVVTPTWRSVDVQYRRPGSRGMGVTAWSQDITVKPTAERREMITVSGVPVEIAYSGDGASASFAHRDSNVIIRFFPDEVDQSGIRALVAAWLEQAR